MSKKLSLSGSGEAHGNIQHGAPPRRQVQLWPATPKERAWTTRQPHSLCSARRPSRLSRNLFLPFTKWHKHPPGHARQESGIHSDHLLPPSSISKQMVTTMLVPLWKPITAVTVPTLLPQVITISPQTDCHSHFQTQLPAATCSQPHSVSHSLPPWPEVS